MSSKWEIRGKSDTKKENIYLKFLCYSYRACSYIQYIVHFLDDILMYLKIYAQTLAQNLRRFISLEWSIFLFNTVSLSLL
jgi:hypothetical protein